MDCGGGRRVRNQNVGCRGWQTISMACPGPRAWWLDCVLRACGHDCAWCMEGLWGTCPDHGVWREWRVPKVYKVLRDPRAHSQRIGLARHKIQLKSGAMMDRICNKTERRIVQRKKILMPRDHAHAWHIRWAQNSHGMVYLHTWQYQKTLPAVTRIGHPAPAPPLSLHSPGDTR